MLRLLIALLLLANLGYFAWSHGLLGEVLPPPDDGREPERLQHQVQPDLIRLGPAELRVVDARGTPPPDAADTPDPALPASVASAAPAAASDAAPAASAASAAVPASSPASSAAAAPPVAVPVPTRSPAPASAPLVAAAPARPASAAGKSVCLEAGTYSDVELPRIRTLLRANLPPGSWQVEQVERPGSFAVYVGGLSSREALLRRQEDLRRQKIESIVLRLPGEQAPGLSLGRFRHRENAEQHLDDLQDRGVRGARVVPVGAPVTLHLVRLPAATPELQQRSARLAPSLRGREFRPCARR